MLFPQYFIDDLRNRTDIVRTIEKYVPLKKKGTNWMACCPFHDEKTPSFSVNQTKGFYKCFGCGKGGNVFTFLTDYEGLSFPDAVRQLAEENGIPVPAQIDDSSYQKDKARTDKKKELAKRVIELNAFALEFWEKHLYDDNAQSKVALAYLKERGLELETLKKFRIGFAPDSWNTMLDLLTAKGADDALIRKSGLISINEEKERIYDRFRGRIIFPVLDVDGNPIAFGARALGNDQPKYLNSPETPAYTKGDHLYGLFQTKQVIRKKNFAILVEGYTDLIVLDQHGITNCVASLGTAFTPIQAKLLRRFARNVVVNYDGDAAGIKAAQRAIEHLLRQDFDIKVLVLPDGSDPDDFVKANGAESYNLRRGKANPYLKFILEQSVKGRDLGQPNQKSAAIEAVLPLISSLRNAIQKRESFDQAMDFLRVDDFTLKNDLWKTVKQGERLEPEKIRQNVIRSVRANLTIAEQRFLELVILDSDLQSELLPEIEKTDYEMLATAPIFEALLELFNSRQTIDRKAIIQRLEDDLIAIDMVQLIYLSEPPREQGDAIDEVLIEAEDCFIALRRMAIARRILEISNELAIAEQESDSEALAKLVSEQIELARVKRELQEQTSD